MLLDVGAGVGFVFVGGGRSPAQASQQRKVDWFSRVHVGQIQGLSYELLSAVKSTGFGASDGLAAFIAFGCEGSALGLAGGAFEGPGVVMILFSGLLDAPGSVGHMKNRTFRALLPESTQ